MCMGDFRLGRLIRSVITPWALGTSLNLSLPSSPQRVGLTLNLTGPAALTGNSIQVSSGGTDISNLSVNIPFRHITMLDFGDLPTKAFLLHGGVGSPSGSWIEYFVPEEALGFALEEILRSYRPWQR